MFCVRAAFPLIGFVRGRGAGVMFGVGRIAADLDGFLPPHAAILAASSDLRCSKNFARWAFAPEACGKPKRQRSSRMIPLAARCLKAPSTASPQGTIIASFRH